MEDQMNVQLFLETTTNLIFFDDGRHMFHIKNDGDLSGLNILIMFEGEACPVKIQYGNISDEVDDQKGIEVAIVENKKVLPVQVILDCATSIAYIIANGMKGTEIGTNRRTETSATESGISQEGAATPQG